MKKILVCFSGIIFLLFAACCDAKFPVQPNVLIGKSKKEVIALAMECAERTSDHKVNFAVKMKNGSAENYYYETKNEAEQDDRLVKSNIWQVFFYKRKYITMVRLS